MYTCTKKFANFPFAHRQPAHKGHCSLIHGHNWAFVFTFGCKHLEPGTEFVVDFGDLKWLKAMLEELFDHTLVLNADDPQLEYLRNVLVNFQSGLEFRPLARLVLVPNCGAEGLAAFLYDEVNRQLYARYNGRVFLHAVVVEEDEKNSAAYSPANGGCNHE
jgi:6-pyruvoyltetrahydropterin/6-carboxytetrahydropterin synthase